MDLIDSIYDIDSLQKAVNTYVTKSEGTFGNPQTELSLAHKLFDLSKNLSDSSDAKKVFDIANEMSNFQIIGRGSKEAKSDFTNCIALAYNSATDIAVTDKLATPYEARHMLAKWSDFSQYHDCPAEWFIRITSMSNISFDDKKVAEDFLKYTEKALQQSDKSIHLYGDCADFIRITTMIVKYNPEMAGKCSRLVNNVVDSYESDSNFSLAFTYDAAHNYYEEVKKMDGVSDSDKSMARVRSTSWKRQAERAKERAKQEKEQSHHQTQQKNKEPNFQKKGPELDL